MCQSYSKPKVGRLLRPGVIRTKFVRMWSLSADSARCCYLGRTVVYTWLRSMNAVALSKMHDDVGVLDWRSLADVLEICRPVNNHPLAE